MKKESIKFADEVIATISAGAVMRVPGVHKVHGAIISDLVKMIKKAPPTSGIKIIRRNENLVDIDIRLIIEYLSSIPEIGKRVKEEVKNFVEKLTSVKVENIRIYIDDVHFWVLCKNHILNIKQRNSLILSSLSDKLQFKGVININILKF